MTAAVRGALVAMVLCGVARPAHAEPTDVPALVKLIETQPGDLDRSVWKDKRRDAARKLVASKDKRAVPELIRLAEGETYDVIGEIAIEGLGTLGDPQAIPALQRIAGDSSRDKDQRELARKALGKLGASAEPSGSTSGVSGSTSGASGSTSGVSGSTSGASGAVSDVSGSSPSGEGDSGSLLLSGGKPSSDLPALPQLADDTLAASERVTFASGAADLSYDTVRKRTDFDADVEATYQKRIERTSLAWGVDGDAHLVAGYIDPTGRAETRGAELDLSVDAEVRLYTGQLYGIGKVAAATQLDYVADIAAMDPANDIRQTKFTADLQLALGGGYGRVLDVGAAIRVRRLSRTLDAAHALGKRIDAATAKKLQLTWWALRGERSTYRALVITVAILREAGVLLGEPDAGLAYEILNVLRDSNLYLRPSGLDLQLTFGEGYLQRPSVMNFAPDETGRVEQLLAAASYGVQLDDDKLELSGTGYGRLRLFSGDGQPSPYAAGVVGRVRRFTYGEHGDPFGALDASLDIELSDDDLMTSDFGVSVTAQVGFTWWLNQASGFRVAGSLEEDQGELFFGVQLQATYGLLDGTFAR